MSPCPATAKRRLIVHSAIEGAMPYLFTELRTQFAESARLELDIKANLSELGF